MRHRRKEPGGRFGVGLVLILLGTLLLLAQLDLIPKAQVFQFWPLILIGLGFAKVLSPGTDPDGRWGGFWLVIVGLYCMISQWHLFGLHWGNSWPLMIIAGGIMMIVKTLARHNALSGTEDRHE